MFAIIGISYDINLENYCCGECTPSSSLSVYAHKVFGPFETEEEANKYETDNAKILYQYDRTYVTEIKTPEVT